MTRARLMVAGLLMTVVSMPGYAENAEVLAAAKAVKDAARIAETDAYWAEVSRTVTEGDWSGYVAGCHPAGVLVAGKGKTCYPLSQALAGWKKDFDDTKAGKMPASVEFRFSQRLGDATTAHETGIFLYKASHPDGKEVNAYVNFEALLVKGKVWQIMMEYQKSDATAEEWEALGVVKDGEIKK